MLPLAPPRAAAAVHARRRAPTAAGAPPRPGGARRRCASRPPPPTLCRPRGAAADATAGAMLQQPRAARPSPVSMHTTTPGAVGAIGLGTATVRRVSGGPRATLYPPCRVLSEGLHPPPPRIPLLSSPHSSHAPPTQANGPHEKNEDAAFIARVTRIAAVASGNGGAGAAAAASSLSITAALAGCGLKSTDPDSGNHADGGVAVSGIEDGGGARAPGGAPPPLAHLAAVLDGHGGRGTAKWAARRLPHLIADNLARGPSGELSSGAAARGATSGGGHTVGAPVLAARPLFPAVPRSSPALNQPSTLAAPPSSHPCPLPCSARVGAAQL
jgi:Mrp family chromosome partitioning ATPase